MIHPYTTNAGVQIGILYTPPAPSYSSKDAMRLQAALLQRPCKPRTTLQRAIRHIVRWL